MPSLRVTKNEELLCVAGSDSTLTFSVSVCADKWGPEGSSLYATGSTKAAEGKVGELLVWQLGHELRPNDRLVFAFSADSTSSLTDETPIDEPNTSDEMSDFFAPITEAGLLTLESRPLANANCTWQFSFPGQPSLFLAPDSERQYCHLHMSWSDHRPDQLRVNLSKASLREMSARAGGEQLFLKYAPLDTQFKLTVET